MGRNGQEDVLKLLDKGAQQEVVERPFPAKRRKE